MTAEMSPSDRIFAEIWNRMTADFGRIIAFRQMGIHGESEAYESVLKANRAYIQQQLTIDESKSVLRDRKKFVESGAHQSMPIEMAKGSVADFRNTLQSAALIFAHAVLDAAVFDCLRICAIESPTYWSEKLFNKKVSLGEVSKNQYAALLQGAISDELTKLERESLMKKVDTVFSICSPTETIFLTNGFRFDRDRLSSLDELRHRLVHEPGGQLPFDTTFDDLDFMRSSGFHIFTMIGNKFDVCFSAEEAMNLLAQRRKVTM